MGEIDDASPVYFLGRFRRLPFHGFGGIGAEQLSLNGVFGNTIPPQATSHIPVVTETGTLAAGASTTPSFTFIPAADDKVAQELLLPVPPDVLYTLFQQGAPVDQLLRLMVERFEIQLPGDTKITAAGKVGFHCGGRLVSVLEGGYDLDALARCASAHVRALMEA